MNGNWTCKHLFQYVHSIVVISCNQAICSFILLLLFWFVCFLTTVVLLEASAVMEVSGLVGGQVSIHCSGDWTTDNSSEQYNLYFCKGVCSRENTVVQTTRTMLPLTQRGRYTMEVNRGDGAFKVTIMRLKKADAGTYHCGVGNTVIVLYQEVHLTVRNGMFLVRSFLYCIYCDMFL